MTYYKQASYTVREIWLGDVEIKDAIILLRFVEIWSLGMMDRIYTVIYRHLV